ncbi:uncharacterized protein LOC144627888 [Crassostrea virginica]
MFYLYERFFLFFFSVNMSGMNHRYAKLALVLAFGVATVLFLTHYYNGVNSFNPKTSSVKFLNDPGLSQQHSAQNTNIKFKSTKCGETYDDFVMAGNEGVKPLTERVAAKFRSMDMSCANRYFPKPNPQLTQEETKRKQACVNTWAADYRKGSGAFWAGNTQYVRHTHHTYLNSESVVFDIGGNKGEDADALIKKFHPGNYLILEPIKTLYSNLVKIFKNDHKVLLYNFGLARKNEHFYVNVLGHGGDATSVFAGNNNGRSCLLRVVNTTHFFLQIGIPCYEVDLITVNCEGCEFEIMEELIASGMISQFRHVQFATHPTLKHLHNAPERYCEIQEKLKRTHTISYQYKWYWESWIRKDL